MKVLVIGGGVLGTMHARAALSAGFDVIHLERDPAPASASVRNFGLIWIGGRASGNELDVSIRARELWGEISKEIPAMSFRANGSLTVAKNEEELQVIEESLQKKDAELRGWKMLSVAETREINPALQGRFLGSLWCPLDAAVEPGSLLSSIREKMKEDSRYTYQSQIEIIDVVSSINGVKAESREREIYNADYAIICPGADHSTLFGNELKSAPIRKVYLQMASTASFDQEITTSIADGDSLRYYPAYDVPSLRNLPAQQPIAANHHMQLLLVQRVDGTLTIGDTHAYDEPFDFKLHEEPYAYLSEVASELLGRQIPPITSRWSGVYSQQVNGGICDRQKIGEQIIVVTGPGGRGNTLAPAIAEETIREMIAQ